MKVIAEYFYENGVEMQQHDIVYLEGEDSNHNVYFRGICRVDGFHGELFSAHFLGQEACSAYDIEVYIEDIDRLTKLDNKDIDKALKKEMLKL